MYATFKRFSLLFIYMSFGMLVCYAIYIGNKNFSPMIGSLLKSVKIAIVRTETAMIYNNRPDSRTKALSWLEKYKKDKSEMLFPDTVLLGLHDNRFASSPEVVGDIEKQINADLALVHIYTAWGSGNEHQFPVDQVLSICQMGSIPVITWEPWLQAFTGQHAASLRPAEERDNNGMADIANGVYDAYIEGWARSASKIKSPIFIRLAHEMNDPYRYPWGPHNNLGNDFVAAWQHVYAVFQKNGASNCIWVWNPHLSYSMFDELYPGDDFVDYIGVNVLNFGTGVSWSDWYSFEEIFGKHYTSLSAYKKPIMIAELASLSYGGSRSQWYAEALKDFPKQYPLVKALLFFHVSDDSTVSDKKLDWAFSSDSAAVDAVKEAIGAWGKY